MYPDDCSTAHAHQAAYDASDDPSVKATDDDAIHAAVDDHAANDIGAPNDATHGVAAEIDAATHRDAPADEHAADPADSVRPLGPNDNSATGSATLRCWS